MEKGVIIKTLKAQQARGADLSFGSVSSLVCSSAADEVY